MGRGCPLLQSRNAQMLALLAQKLHPRKLGDRCGQSIFEVFFTSLFVVLSDWQQPGCLSISRTEAPVAHGTAEGWNVVWPLSGGDGPMALLGHQGKKSEPRAQDRFIVNGFLEPGALVALTLCRIRKNREMDWEPGSGCANPTLTLTRKGGK